MYRSEHPRPQFERKNWENLNGEWDFEFDQGNSGEDRGFWKNEHVLPQKIQVPFCPESKLSGIADTDYHLSVWYRRKVNIDPDKLNGRVFLHFGAVDYHCKIYVNQKKVWVHDGGYVSFQFEITDWLKAGENVITVHAVDDTRNPLVPSGKQSYGYYSFGCFYTRTTGIWQTVWLEYTPKNYIAKTKFYPDLKNGTLTVQAQVVGSGKLSLETSFAGKPMGKACLESAEGFVSLTVALAEIHPWELGKGGLYDLHLTFGEDEVKSYFGLRSIEYIGKKFLLNGKSVFQRLVLDQGFYPDGIYTAPDDSELRGDIERSMAMGFNGARLHEKVFEERFLYHADCKGYLVWGEYPNWGLDTTDPKSLLSILPEWIEEVERDFNHPSIVGWCPFNETPENECREVLSTVYHATKAIDATRPCIDTSGYVHVITDIYDIHDYNQDPVSYKESLEKIIADGNFRKRPENRLNLSCGDHFFISEYGGIRWSEKDGWGYGDAPKTEEEFLSRLKGLTDAMLDNPDIFAYCYTQLTDVEQEQNGVYTYDRIPKFPPEVLSPIFGKKAAIED